MLAEASLQSAELLPLRKELCLSSAPLLDTGVPTWTIEDPIRNKFFRIGRQEMELLARWESADADTLAERLFTETGVKASVEEIVNLQQFLLSNSLLDPVHPQVQAHLCRFGSKAKNNLLAALVQRIVFFRIPLLNPDHFLEKTLPFVRPLGSRGALFGYALIALLAVILITPQWSSFFSTFSFLFSFEGIAAYFFTLFGVKFLHEFGHAYTAKHFGLQVPTIGLAFIVFWPLFYTDNNQAWRIKDRHIRMKIVAAGMLTELVIASCAALGWVLMQPGLAKSLCFVLATTSILHSLFINICPFMRFDGYYLLSDYLDIANLAPRSFALGRYHLRLSLFGLDSGKPEPFSGGLELFLCLYCYATWIYRFFLFTTIALVVYHFFFKALGLLLFAAEIYLFIIRPIANEIKHWWTMRSSLTWNPRLAMTSLLFLLALFGLLYPLPTRILIPAVIMAEQTAHIYPPFPAQLEEILVEEGQAVTEGDLLYALKSQRLETENKLLDLEIEALQTQLRRDQVSKESENSAAVTEDLLAQALAKQEGLRTQHSRLRLYSPITGVVSAINTKVVPGTWVSSTVPLSLILGNDGAIIEGYIKEGDLRFLQTPAEGFFLPESGDRERIPSVMTELDHSTHDSLLAPELASLHGGDIAVLHHQPGELPPLAETRYLIHFKPLEEFLPHQRVRGHIILRGKEKSLVARLWLSLAPGVIRESNL